MIKKPFALLLLGIVLVMEAGALFWIRSDYRSVMLDGQDYTVPAAIDYAGDFYHRNYLPVDILLTEAPWKGNVTPEAGQIIYVTVEKNEEGMGTASGAYEYEPKGNYVETRMISYANGKVTFHFPADRLYMLPEQLKQLAVVELSEKIAVKVDKNKTELRPKNKITAQIRVKDGRAVIAEVFANGSPIEQTYATVGKNLSIKYASGPKEKDRYDLKENYTVRDGESASPAVR